MDAVKATPRDNSSITRDRSSPAVADAMLEFGRFRVLLRQRQLVADGVPIELGTRALDLLLVLLEADGSLITKEELMLQAVRYMLDDLQATPGERRRLSEALRET